MESSGAYTVVSLPSPILWSRDTDRTIHMLLNGPLTPYPNVFSPPYGYVISSRAPGLGVLDR